ncbi:MAG: hypothetical protein F4Y63_07620 [Chloroflexi bacterium]|nr:hypothetical protein [Chloroflexota bacterium]
MDRMERYKIEGSIKDVIAILDSAPMQRDMVPEVNSVQLTNRVPIAHLAIERGLKALIADSGAEQENTHSLHKLYRDLKSCDDESATFLELAFDDAVDFFGYNVNAEGLRHFRSLKEYLSKTGHANAFNALRYWAIGDNPKGEDPIPYISPPIHRELLCALASLIGAGRNTTVSQRVEQELHHTMFRSKDMWYASDDLDKKQSIDKYLNWLFNMHKTRRSALEEAVALELDVIDDEFMRRTLKAVHEELKQSNDPAVRYLIRRLSYLPKASQRRNPDAVPEVQWFNGNETRGMVATSAGTGLGYVEKYADGGWGITPSESGEVRVTDIAEALADAKHYLVNRLTHRVDVVVNGETRPLRIVGEGRHLFFSISDAEWTTDCDQIELKREYELEFWDDAHGLASGDQVVVKLRRHEFRGLIDMLEGEVHSIDGHKVSINGRDYGTLDDEV